MLATEPVSVQLRYLQTLAEIGVEKNTTGLERLSHIAWTAAPMLDHANALPSPSRFECAKADFDAFVAEHCEMFRHW